MRTFVSIGALALLVGCGSPAPPPARAAEPSAMSEQLSEPGWSDENRARLERMLDTLAAREGRRVAVLDWDNTMMRGDIGDLVLAHLVEDGAIDRTIPADDPMLTPAAHRALAAAEDPTSRGRVIAHLAWRGQTPEGEPAFPIPVTRFHRASYGVIAQALAMGRTDEELRAIAREVFARASVREVGASDEIGGVRIDRFARLHTPMIELARALEAAGVEVWIVSASSQPIVEAMAEIAGLPPARVIGARMEHDEAGRGTARFEPCGEGALETPVMTWLEGKRCWINRVIFGVEPARQRARQDDPALRPVFAAGDSDGDLAMLVDATEGKLVLDRHAPRLLCHALARPDRWLLQTLFVAPPPPRDRVVPCASLDDGLGPVLDETGAPIPDQPPR